MVYLQIIKPYDNIHLKSQIVLSIWYIYWKKYSQSLINKILANSSPPSSIFPLCLLLTKGVYARKPDKNFMPKREGVCFTAQRDLFMTIMVF